MKKSLLILSACFILLATLTAEMMSDNGIAGYAGSPGENKCNNCHSTYAINSGAGSIELRTGMTNNEYVPGQTYDMTFKVAFTGRHLFGMGLEALNSTNTNAGTLVITDAVHTTTKNATVGTASRKSVVHTLNGGNSQDSMLFHFRWIAPTTGTVTFYYCGACTNASATNAGDYIYNGSTVVNPAGSTGINGNSTPIGVSIYPNPTSQSLHINCTAGSNGITSFELYSIDGKLVRAENRTLLAGQQVELLWNEMAAYPNGVYLLHVRNAAGESTKRIVIQ
jgi:hypothetical protein